MLPLLPAAGTTFRFCEGDASKGHKYKLAMSDKEDVVLGTTLLQEARYTVACAFAELTREQAHPCASGGHLLKFWVGDMPVDSGKAYLRMAAARWAARHARRQVLGLKEAEVSRSVSAAVKEMQEAGVRVLEADAVSTVLEGARALADCTHDPDGAFRWIGGFALAYAQTDVGGWKAVAQLWHVLGVQDAVAMQRALRNGIDTSLVPLIRPMELPLLPTCATTLSKHTVPIVLDA